MGSFTELLQAERLVVMDVDPQYVGWIRARFGTRANFAALQADLADPRWVEHGRSFGFDTVVCLNVLEHIEDDVRALRHLYEVLSPSGKLILLVPAFMLLYGAMDRADGHVRRHRRRDLAQKLARSGFAVRKLHYMNALGFLGWLVNGRLLKEKGVSARKVRQFDRLVPLCAWVESWIAPPFGQSLLAIAERA